MAKTIQPWEAEVDEGSATPTPAKAKGAAVVIAPKKLAPKVAPKSAPQTVPVGQAEVDDASIGKKKGGMVRGHGCESKGKTKGRYL